MSSESENTPSDERLRVSAASSMRAMAHPARLASIHYLTWVGPATATELGERAGLTPSAMSYHLRAMERAGLIETAPSRGDGRERLWQSKHTGGWEVESFEDGTAETRQASVELMDTILAMQELDVRRWLSRADEPGWLDTGFFANAAILVNQAELEEIGKKISDLFTSYHARNREGPIPPDAVRMRTVFRGFPTEALPERDMK
jgi:DNA-binding transcriptional ArsR family regulator